MNSIESAASLFGSDDSCPDPFAVLGNDETQTTTPNATNDVRDMISGNPGAESAATNLFGTEDLSSNAQYTLGLESTSQDPYTYNAPNYLRDFSENPSYVDQQGQGRCDDHGQWQPNQYSPTQPTETSERFLSPSSTDI